MARELSRWSCCMRGLYGCKSARCTRRMRRGSAQRQPELVVPRASTSHLEQGGSSPARARCTSSWAVVADASRLHVELGIQPPARALSCRARLKFSPARAGPRWRRHGTCLSIFFKLFLITRDEFGHLRTLEGGGLQFVGSFRVMRDGYSKNFLPWHVLPVRCAPHPCCPVIPAQRAAAPTRRARLSSVAIPVFSRRASACRRVAPSSGVVAAVAASRASAGRNRASAGVVPDGTAPAEQRCHPSIAVAAPL